MQTSTKRKGIMATDIDKIRGMAQDVITECYETGNSACVLVGFNDAESDGGVIRAAVGDAAQLIVLIAIELATLCKQTGAPLNELMKSLKAATKDCLKRLDETEHKDAE